MPYVRILSVPLAELQEGAMQAHTVDGREILLCRTKEGVYALDNICTHAYARLSEGRLRACRLICPLHGASFDVRDGRPLGLPAITPLPVHGVTVGTDVVLVDVEIPDERPLHWK